MSYDDTNDRDIRAKQESEPASSQSVASTESKEKTSSQSTTEEPASAEAEDVRVLPGTGGPDDVGDVDVDPSELNMSGH
jgi:hypothetical protein